MCGFISHLSQSKLTPREGGCATRLPALRWQQEVIFLGLRPWNNAETQLDCYKTCEANGIKLCYGKLTFPIWPLQGQHTASYDSKWILWLSSSKTSVKWRSIIYLKLFVPHGNFPSRNKYCMCILTVGHMHRWMEYDTNPSETLYSTIALGALPPYLPPL